MKRTLVLGGIVFAGCLFAETVDEAYARLSSYRSLWETNTVAYYKTVRAISDPAFAIANGKWFIDFLSYPDESVTNSIEDVLYAREKVLLRNTSSYGIVGNTNCWYALADYIAHLKDVSDPRWIDERYEVITGYFDDGVAICANTNPLLNFASYKLEHYEEYKRQHTNLVTDVDVANAFHKEWSRGVQVRQEKEWALRRIHDFAKQRIKMDFWLVGAKDLPADIKAVCRSNIVERAHLTPGEEHDIFEDIPY